MTLVGTPTPLRVGAAENAVALAASFETRGVEPWARESMAGRLGSSFPPEGVEWRTKFMACTAVSTQVGFLKTIACDIPKITCPTLVITTEGSGLASVDETRARQQIIPNPELLVLPGNSYHVAASHAVQCAQATLAFIERRALVTERSLTVPVPGLAFRRSCAPPTAAGSPPGTASISRGPMSESARRTGHWIGGRCRRRGLLHRRKPYDDNL